jgi:methionyl-tRNA formyltransferase
LQERLQDCGHLVDYIFNKNELKESDACFLLSCSKLVTRQHLQLSRHNIVVHASDLPAGKGFSPLQWQILEGRSEIVLTLFEAVEACDAGPYYLKERLCFDGTELYDELRAKLAQKIIEMCLTFVGSLGEMRPIPQCGQETVYPRRTSHDDELDVQKSLADQFDHLRVADNDKHPLYFYHRDCKYLLKVYKAAL